MQKPFFNVLHTSKKSSARVGEIHTPHGVVKTPAFVPCATKGTLKTILPSLIPAVGVQVAFVNVYHLVTHPGADVIEKARGIHEYSKLDIPLMSDSGGFQVFSLASQKSKLKSQNYNSKVKRNNTRKADVRGEEEPFVLKISDDGVKFRSTHDGVVIEFSPEKSMEYQRKIGADMVMAFDECLQPGVDEKYAERSMERTHEWLKRCISVNSESNSSLFTTELDNERTTRTSSRFTNPSCSLKQTHKQYLYGIIQGGRFEDLRKKSAEFVVSQNTPGVAIGGVAVGETKQEMRQEVEWISPFLPKDRPVHLLGVGRFDDVIDLVTHGIDTFDCVEPTRLARMGIIFQLTPSKILSLSRYNGIDILKSVYKNDLSQVDENCSCYVCKNFTKSYLHHLFKQREILGYILATYHNLFVMEQFFDIIRNSISQDLI